MAVGVTPLATPAGSSPRVVKQLALTPRGQEARRSGGARGSAARVLDLLGDRPGDAASLGRRMPEAREAIPGLIADGLVREIQSLRSPAARVARLREAGVSAEELARLRSPVGLDIGARTPEETAVSIVSEIISLRTGRSAQALSASDGPIHD